MNAESFSLYAAQVLALEQDMEPGQTANISVTGENLGIRSNLYITSKVNASVMNSLGEEDNLSIYDGYNNLFHCSC